MQLHLKIILGLISIPLVFGSDLSTDQSMNDLFRKYEMVMDQKKTEYIDQVFSKRFIKESGGKKLLVKKILNGPSPLTPQPQLKWTLKKGAKSDLYLAKVSEINPEKITQKKAEAEFIIIKEDGVFKIEGTLSDDN
jgi:hypothetical protein